MIDEILGINREVPPDATCFYCTYWSQKWEGTGKEFRYLDKGYCYVKKRDTENDTPVCNMFRKRPYMFTPYEIEQYENNDSK